MLTGRTSTGTVEMLEAIVECVCECTEILHVRLNAIEEE